MVSVERYLYISRGLVDGVTVKNDVFVLEADETWTCYSMATQPEGLGPRVGHAAVSTDQGIIMFFGSKVSSREGPLDKTIYLWGPSKATPALTTVQD